MHSLSRVELAGDSLLGDDIEDTESKEALEHLSNQAAELAWKPGAWTDCRYFCQAPLPAKRHHVGTKNRMSKYFFSSGVVSFSTVQCCLGKLCSGLVPPLRRRKREEFTLFAQTFMKLTGSKLNRRGGTPSPKVPLQKET